MLKLEYFVVCESTSIDSPSNAVSIFNIIEAGTPASFPFVIPKISAIACWIREGEGDPEEGDHQALIKVFRPGEDEPASGKVNFTEKHDRYRARFILDNLQIKNPGKLLIKVFLDGEYNASHQIIINEAQKPAEENESA